VANRNPIHYPGRVKASKITKIAGVTLAGFVVASIAADKANLGPVLSQVAGFAGALAGTLVGRRKRTAPGTSGAEEPGDRLKPVPPGIS
jgi:hypothetical protein